MSEHKLDYERAGDERMEVWRGWLKFCCASGGLLALILLGLLTVYFH